ncbi:MAG: peptide deformylase [Spirochaetota bacterium]|nr:peptide deformylase [Spirochaetota bacterium]
MSILKIAQLGHPVLRTVTNNVENNEIKSNEIQCLIDNMIETMHEYEGLGIAAPQVHVSKRIVVIESFKTNRYPDAPEIPQIVMINPEIEYLTDDLIESWEGCLSIPNLRGKVPRCQKVKVTFLNRLAEKTTIEAQDFFSIVIQHETDHLDGLVFLDRMQTLTSLSYLTEYKKYFL